MIELFALRLFLAFICIHQELFSRDVVLLPL